MSFLLLGAGRTASAGGSSFTSPMDLTGLIGWWDAAVFASFTMTGSNIDAWADQSGSSNHMAWAGFGKPIYAATGFNSSYPAMTLSATAVGNAMMKTSFPMGTGNTLTAWYVGRLNQSTANSSCRAIAYAPPSGDDTTGISSWSISNKASDPLNLMQFSRNNTTTQFGCTANANHRVILTIDSGGVQKVYVDNTATTLATASGNWTSGGTLNIGRASPSGSAYWGGPFAELGVATGWHDATTVTALDNYLKTKWGL